MSAPTVDLSTVPGAMERTLRREIPDGLIEFEEAPVGYLTKKGEPRKKPWRAYFWQPHGSDRVRLPSITTLIGAIDPKPGLPPWAEAEGIKGTVEAFNLGLIPPGTPPDEVVAIVRRHKLGADAAKLEAAERGLNVHAINEDYLLTGKAPKISDHPEHHKGFIQAWTRWALARNPEPVSVEEIVINPEAGYAGRLDLRCRVGGELCTYDAKTQENGAIYRSAHFQVALCERGAIRCGEDPADRCFVVVFAANGEFREMEVLLEDWQVDAALSHYRGSRPVDSACESANRFEKKIRQAAWSEKAAV